MKLNHRNAQITPDSTIYRHSLMLSSLMAGILSLLAAFPHHCDAQSSRSRFSQLEFDRVQKTTENKTAQAVSPLEKTLLQVVNSQQQSKNLKQGEPLKQDLLSRRNVSDNRTNRSMEK